MVNINPMTKNKFRALVLILKKNKKNRKDCIQNKLSGFLKFFLVLAS